MALNAYLRVLIEGTPVPSQLGQDRTVETLGGMDVSDRLEVLYFRAGTEIAARSGHGARSVGHRRHTEAVFVTRLGAATPLLARAMAESQVVELDLALFGLNRNTGEAEHHFTYGIGRGRLVRLEVQHPNTLGPQASTLPTMVRFGVSPQSVSLASVPSATEFFDDPAGPSHRA